MHIKTWKKSLFTLITGLSLLINTNSVQSQIIPDNTLGNEKSKFTPSQAKDLIEGGAIRGNNLFHSFSDFNVNNNQQVYFNNPVLINNIITRVTGNNISNILGTLGVDGNANLFLINPHGIIFGKDAKLDVKGSFLASTANAIKFSDNTLFSAKDTNTTPLLTMSVPVGVQWGNNQSGDITNNGDLSTGKDLTLSGRNVNIKEANLQTGGNLTLESQEKVTIEDSMNKPVILKSAGDMTIQGNQSVEINALNHSDSSITANRDIIFRSPVRLLSNGKYTVGGYFTTEDLNGNVIDFLIPHNNIIKVNGDITLDDYTGSSLYILASGKVTLGNITINATDNKPITQTIADGKGGNQTVTINSKNDVGILDVRAGIDANKLPNILEDHPNLLSNADINTGDITNSGGNVLLTNQYKPNNQLPSANITVGVIDTSTFDGKDGGSIALTTTQGHISTQFLNSSSFSFSGNAGNGGSIALTTNQGNITTQFLNSSSFSDSGNAENGGSIALTTTGGNITTQSLYSFSYSESGNAGNGGAIALTTTEGNITTQFLSSVSFSISGNAGNGGSIALTTTGGNITTQSLYSFSYSESGNAGNGGAIAFTTIQGNITTQDLNSFSYSESGNAGNGGAINLKALEGDIMGIKALEGNIMGDGLNSFSIAEKGNAGTSGNVTLVAKNNISNLEILTFSNYKSGTVDLTGFGDLSLTNTKIITSQQTTIKNPVKKQDITFKTGKVGQSGDVTITGLGNITLNNSGIESDTKGIDPAGNVTITSPGFLTFNQSYIESDTSSTGQAGSINIKAAQGINFTDAKSSLSANTNNQGNAGNITVETANLTLKNGANITTSTTDTGKAGDILLHTATLTVASGGKILASTSGSGDGGTITVNAPTSVNLGLGVQDYSPVISVETSGAGKAGNIIINTPDLTVSDTAKITATAKNTATNKDGGGSITLNANKMNLAGKVGIFAETQGQAPAGTLKLNPYNNQNTLDLTLYPGSIISGSTSGSGNGGDFQVTAPDTINITGKGKLAVETKGIGNAGNILISTQNLNIKEAEITANTTGEGKAGSINFNAANINIEKDGKISATTSGGEGGSININNAQKLNLNSGSQLLTTTSGNNAAGDINIKVKDSINLNGENTGFFANTAPNSTGNGGKIEINTITMNLENGAKITVNSEGSGLGGKILLEMEKLGLNNSVINAATSGQGDAGNIEVKVQDLNMKTGEISANTTGAGKAGNININAANINIEKDGKISATTSGGEGGSININNAQKLNLKSGSQLLTTTSGNNAAGDINIQVKDSINLNGENTGFFANTAKNSTGNGGNIKIDPITMNIANGAKIAVNSEGTGIGGNIFLQADNLKLNNGFINAETVNSNGGGITLQIGNYLLLENSSKITSTAGTSQSGGNGEILKLMHLL